MSKVSEMGSEKTKTFLTTDLRQLQLTGVSIFLLDLQRKEDRSANDKLKVERAFYPKGWLMVDG